LSLKSIILFSPLMDIDSKILSGDLLWVDNIIFLNVHVQAVEKNQQKYVQVMLKFLLMKRRFPYKV